MRFEFTVGVDLERLEGKFESKSNLEEELLSSLENANPGTITGPDNGGEYEIINWEIGEVVKSGR